MYGHKAAHGKGAWHITWDGKRVWTRSSWEMAFFMYLDNKEINYEVESICFPIKYNYEGVEKEGTYRPDVYLPDINEFIEIKGFWRDDAKEKYDAFLSQYPEIKIKLYFKENLIELGIIGKDRKPIGISNDKKEKDLV